MDTPPPQGPPQGQAGGPPPGPQPGQMPGPGAIPIRPGQRPTPEQIQQVQRKIAEDAQKAGMTIPQFIEHLKKQAQERMAAQQGGQPGAPQQVRQGPPGQTRQAITPGPPKPEALAVAQFLRSQDLKTRTCILNGERKDMFRGM